MDGLRFVALFMVICIAHIPNFLNRKIFNSELIQPGYWNAFSMDGVFGVFLFFIISGFVLGLGFAKSYTGDQERLSLKKYYIRRLTRIEPPYVIALVIFFLALVFVIKKYSFSELFPHFLYSLGYLHNTVYYQNSWVLPVAWTLEIEIQFYIIAPLAAQLYRIRSRQLRWIVFSILILSSAIGWYGVHDGYHVIKFLHYFMSGMLLADLYVENKKLPLGRNIGAVLGLLSLVIMFFVLGYYHLVGYIVKMILMFFFTHLVISNDVLKKMFSFRFIALIGGMCYSFYLVHEQIMSASGYLFNLFSTGHKWPDAGIYYLLSLVCIVIFSSLFFILFEKPFMYPGWWKHILARKEKGS